MNLKIKLIFLIKSFFLHNQKSWQKLKYLENEKNFKMKQKSYLKGFQWSK